MAILVLGGAGYIGSHTVYELIDAGRDVVVADNLQTGFKAAVHPRARFYQADIRDRAAMDALFEKENIEGVIHFAASSQVGESMSAPLKYYDNNLGGTMVLLASMVAHGVDRIVFSSTAATYGEPEQVPILEGDKTQPTNCYGETKLAMEHMMSWVSHQLLRRDQAGHGAHDELGVPCPRPAVRGPAVLQRLRRPSLRRHWRGPQPGDPPGAHHPPGAQRPT